MAFNEAALSEVANLYQSAMDTPERAELDGAYAECVQTEGYDASLPQDMQMMVWGLGVDVPPEERTRLELRIASADVACRLKTRIPFEVAVGRALLVYIVERYPELAKWAPPP